MDPFTRFNRRGIADRQIDTLIGLSKGLLADGTINQAEAEVLLNWLVQNRSAGDNPVVANLLDKVSTMLQDGVLDAEEARELSILLQKFVGPEAALGELAKSTTLPLDDPEQPIVFQGRKFLLTGTFAFGTRRQCEEALISRGALLSGGVTKGLDYLVIGTYVTDSWKHETFGTKIQKAVEYRDSGVPLAIVSEAHWLEEGGFSHG